jgi:hypothetical protein
MSGQGSGQFGDGLRREAKKISQAPKWVLLSLGTLIVLLVAARLALPWAVKSYVNKTLNSIPGYKGSVDEVGISLWRGSYSLEGLKLVKVNGNESEPFFSVDEIDAGIDWRALLQRRIVARLRLERPELQFIVRATKEASQTSIDESWQDKVAQLIPFQINELRVYDGLVRYEDKTSEPKIDLYFQKLEVAAENISNANRSDALLPSPVTISSLFLEGKINALADPIEADLKGKVNGLHLKEINDFARAYGAFDFEKGDLDITTELAASKTQYKGYVKTIAKNIEILDFSKELKEGKPLGNLVWQGAVGAIMAIFKNHSKDRFAARIPILGNRADLKIDKWSTVGSILRNTFIQALSPELEDSVKFADVQTPAKDTESGTSSAKTEAPSADRKSGKRESSGVHLKAPEARKKPGS